MPALLLTLATTTTGPAPAPGGSEYEGAYSYGAPVTPPTSTGGAPGGNRGEGLETLLWIEPDGTATALVEANGLIVTDGPSGRFLAPLDLTEDVVAGRDGSLFRAARLKARDVSIPLVFLGDDRLDARYTYRMWARRFAPLRGDGTLRALLGDGTARDLTGVRLISGLVGDESRSASSPRHLAAVVTLRAADPYFYDAQVTTRVVAGGDQTGFFPLLPLHLSQGAIGSTVTINNDGDASTWPVWTVVGPGTGITITNQTTGDVLAMPAVALTAGQSLVIDTQPGEKTVTRNDGTNLYGQLSSTAALWPLVDGRNDVLVTVGSSSSATLVTVAYQRRWLTA